MKLARVKGIAWPGRKVDGIEGTRIVFVSIVGDDKGDSLTAAADPLQAGVGDYVLMTEGPAVSAALRPGSLEPSPLDAAIVAILQPDELKPRLFE